MSRSKARGRWQTLPPAHAIAPPGQPLQPLLEFLHRASRVDPSCTPAGRVEPQAVEGGLSAP